MTIINEESLSSSIHVRIRMREFEIPPITDALVIGKNAPIGAEAIRRALSLLQVAPFETVPVNDDVISDILVRASVLHKIPREKLVTLVVLRVKPFMTQDEVTHVDIETELTVEERI